MCGVVEDGVRISGEWEPTTWPHHCAQGRNQSTNWAKRSPM